MKETTSVMSWCPIILLQLKKVGFMVGLMRISDLMKIPAERVNDQTWLQKRLYLMWIWGHIRLHSDWHSIQKLSSLKNTRVAHSLASMDHGTVRSSRDIRLFLFHSIMANPVNRKISSLALLLMK